MNMCERSFQPSRLRRKKGKKHVQVEVDRAIPTHIKESKRGCEDEGNHHHH